MQDQPSNKDAETTHTKENISTKETRTTQEQNAFVTTGIDLSLPKPHIPSNKCIGDVINANDEISKDTTIPGIDLLLLSS